MGKQAANGNENQGSGTGGQGTDSPHDTTMNNNSNPGSNNNSNERQQGDMNDKLNKWNDEWRPQQLGNDNGTTNIDELQAFNVNFNFRNVPKAKTGILMVTFIHECILKDNSVEFHPTNRQKLPVLTPFRTKETMPKTTDKFLEFFHAHLDEKGMNTYFLVKSNFMTMQLQGRVLPFMKINNVWINNKQIDGNQPMDAAIIYNEHYKYGNKHVCWKKIVNALGKVELAEDVTDKQKRVLEELQHTEHHNWMIQAKRHSYTDGVNPRVSTEGLIVVVKKPLLRTAREIFALVSIQYPVSGVLGRSYDNITNRKWRRVRI